MHSSNASRNSRVAESLPCRLAWRRSPLLLATLVVLAVLAAISPWLSNLPTMWCALVDGAVVAFAAFTLWRQFRRAPVELVWAGGDAPWQVVGDGKSRSMHHVEASLRGPIAALTLANAASARRQRFVWWPDTLDAAGRRSLRLALASRAAAMRARNHPAQAHDVAHGDGAGA